VLDGPITDTQDGRMSDPAESPIPPGIDLVAMLSGVSRATVSRSFTRPEVVNPMTRARVLSVAHRVGYRPYARVRPVVAARTGTIGLFVPDIANPYFPPLIKEVQARARQRGFTVMLADSDEHTEDEAMIVADLAAQTDGIVVVSPRMADGHLRRLAASRRLVLVSRDLPGHTLSVLQSEQGLTQAIQHLRVLGHGSVLYMTGPAESRSNDLRSAAITRAGEAANIVVTEIGPFEPRYEAGESAIDLVLALRPTAIIAYNDVMALGLIAQMQRRDITVGSDVSIIGIDDIWAAQISAPPLTTVRVPIGESATVAVGLLLDLLEGGAEPPLQPVEIPSRLVVRATTGPVSNQW
jgi:DNA-binding LacI/PurR family transcriptional regulator